MIRSGLIFKVLSVSKKCVFVCSFPFESEFLLTSIRFNKLFNIPNLCIREVSEIFFTYLGLYGDKNTNEFEMCHKFDFVNYLKNTLSLFECLSRTFKNIFEMVFNSSGFSKFFDCFLYLFPRVFSQKIDYKSQWVCLSSNRLRRKTLESVGTIGFMGIFKNETSE